MALYDKTIQIQHPVQDVWDTVKQITDDEPGTITLEQPYNLLVVNSESINHIYYFYPQADDTTTLRYVLTEVVDVTKQLEQATQVDDVLNALHDNPAESVATSAEYRLDEVLRRNKPIVSSSPNRDSEVLVDAKPEKKVVFPTKRPWITYSILALNVLIFFISHGAHAYLWGATNRIMIFEFGDYYRLWTAMFLHADVTHLFFNMLALYFIGNALEGRIGHLRFGILYLLTGFVGSLTSVLLNNPEVSSVGASGAVFGIFGALLVHEWKYRDIFGNARNSTVGRRIAFSMVLNLINGFTPRTTEAVIIDNWAHLGGFVSGVVVVSLIMRTLVYNTNWETGVLSLESKHLRWLQVFVGGMAAAIFLMLIFPSSVFSPSRTVTVDNLTVTVPRGWRVITEFDTPNFADICPAEIRCQLFTSPTDATLALMIKRHSSMTNLLVSSEAVADALVTGIERQFPDTKLDLDAEVTVANVTAIERTYVSSDYEFWFYVFKPTPAIVEIVQIDGNREDVVAHQAELQSIVNSIQFEIDNTGAD